MNNSDFECSEFTNYSINKLCCEYPDLTINKQIFLSFVFFQMDRPESVSKDQACVLFTQLIIMAQNKKLLPVDSKSLLSFLKHASVKLIKPIWIIAINNIILKHKNQQIFTQIDLKNLSPIERGRLNLFFSKYTTQTIITKSCIDRLFPIKMQVINMLKNSLKFKESEGIIFVFSIVFYGIMGSFLGLIDTDIILVLVLSASILFFTYHHNKEIPLRICTVRLFLIIATLIISAFFSSRSTTDLKPLEELSNKNKISYLFQTTTTASLYVLI